MKKIHDFLETISHNDFLSIVFCWTGIVLGFTLVYFVAELVS